MLKLGNAPVSWGVDYADAPGNPPWQSVLDAIADARYSYTELGPVGYYPTEPQALRDAFASRGLTVQAGFVFQPLHEPSARADILATVHRTVDLLAAVGATRLVTIDHISEPRMAVAGRRDLAPALPPAVRDHMVALIHEIADIALAKGVLPVLHQHAGCWIEYEDELEDIAARLDPARVGLCIDTGHMRYAGIDPIAFYRRHADRVRYFHFKEVAPEVHARVLRERIGFLPATSLGVF